jgi:hypothetical protein
MDYAKIDAILSELSDTPHNQLVCLCVQMLLARIRQLEKRLEESK